MPCSTPVCCRSTHGVLRARHAATAKQPHLQVLPVGGLGGGEAGQQVQQPAQLRMRRHAPAQLCSEHHSAAPLFGAHIAHPMTFGSLEIKHGRLFT